MKKLTAVIAVTLLLLLLFAACSGTPNGAVSPTPTAPSTTPSVVSPLPSETTPQPRGTVYYTDDNYGRHQIKIEVPESWDGYILIAEDQGQASQTFSLVFLPRNGLATIGLGNISCWEKAEFDNVSDWSGGSQPIILCSDTNISDWEMLWVLFPVWSLHEQWVDEYDRAKYEEMSAELMDGAVKFILIG
ncbi:MAG: hypothetical protein LBN02_05635 [Oscillospiraceae bacterium]|jgi:hypothetical protein|nr:hypothetical protein [Oscillospiraceae bacterium]